MRLDCGIVISDGRLVVNPQQAYRLAAQIVAAADRAATWGTEGGGE